MSWIPPSRNWFDLLTPGGRIVAIYGLVDADTSNNGSDESADDTDEDRPTDKDGDVFTEYYTLMPQAALEAMRLDSHDRLVAAAQAGGLANIEVVTLSTVRGWEISPGSQQPHALIGHRPKSAS